jgi:hypothetical protein
MKPFDTRLQWCMRHGNLRVADLARWFGRPHATVRGWVLRKLNPSGSELDVEHIHSLLGLLETLIKARKRFPLPLGLKPADRKTWLAQTRRTVLP